MKLENIIIVFDIVIMGMVIFLQFFFMKQWNESFLNGLTEKNDQTTIAKAYKDSSVSPLISILYY